MPSDYAIEAFGLNKVYRSRFRGREIKAVDDLTLRVPAGTKFGLLGANGAGKTTFVKMLLSAVHPTTGSALVFGVNSALPEARRPIGYLPENHRFPTYFTGEGMLDFYAALSGMDTDSRKKRTAELLDRVGLTGWGDVRIKKYSKGMLQRLGLAQALMHRPRLLILDEPTDGVDPVGRRQIRDILNQLLDDGVTIFLNSHLLSEVETFCEHVAILKKGRLALEGRITDLIAGRGYRLKAVSVTDQARAALVDFGSSIASQNGFLELHVTQREQVNQAIDVLRDAGASIESVIPTTSTLEDVFIETTEAR